MKFIILLPIFIPYLLLSFIIPLFKFGKIKKGKGVKMYISKDLIHSDYIFNSKHITELFPHTKEKYIKVGWGDKKIFLETQNWNDLKLNHVTSAFFGLNKTVLRIEGLNKLPNKYKKIEINHQQLEILKKHIKNSHNGKLIKKKKEHYQFGDYYESNLQYNCITNCNNWVNYGLRLAQISNRIWCPLSYWI